MTPEQMAAEFRRIRPAGGFKAILCDHPWEFETFSEKGNGKSASRHYDTMTIEEIKAIPLQILAAENCAMFTWNIWPFMRRWNEVIEAHGFTYAGLGFEWVKYNTETGKYAFGGGYGTRKNLEPCLLATRGNPSLRKDLHFFGETVPAEGARSVRDFIEWCPLDAIRAPRREHSRKPDEQYIRIETMFDGPYVELFSRSNRKGWTSFGNQSGMFGEVAA